MRILLAHNSTFFPAHGGGDKSNRLLMEALAARGHECLVVARTGGFGPEEHPKLLHQLAQRAVEAKTLEPGVVWFRRNGLESHVVTHGANLRTYFHRQVDRFAPEVIVASTDDPAQLLLEVAVNSPARVVYLARATLALPFGPDCAFPSESKTEVLRACDAAVGVSHYVADYMRVHGGIAATHAPISLLEPGPFPILGGFENEFVTFVNPCAVKGIEVFLRVAERLPRVRFAAVPTWGTNAQDRAVLAALPNVTCLDPVDNVDELFQRTRVLLVPSLWAEARSRIVVEAMLRGVPVLASDIGGIPEAKMGVPYLLPVNPIVHYRPQVDEQMVPVAEVPRQDVTPWVNALSRVVSDRSHYDELSRASRDAAVRYADALSAAPFERVLESVAAASKRPGRAMAAGAPAKADPLEKLSPEKRRLLALMLQKKKAAPPPDPWFGAAAGDARLSFFCFPHAGGGTTQFVKWQRAFPQGIAVTPARLPGREARASEPAIETMDGMVAALADAIGRRLDGPYVLYGHSMGATIAFELAREVRRRAANAPVALLVSGARAPQFRRDPIPGPEPDDVEFLAELGRLEGLPAELLEDAEAVRLLLPVLRADSRLYRNYVYRDAAPLECAIRVYGGLHDPRIPQEQFEAWSEQTTGSFACRMFDGGHFFTQSHESQFLGAVVRDLHELGFQAATGASVQRPW